jgi:hypothetical protein
MTKVSRRCLVRWVINCRLDNAVDQLTMVLVNALGETDERSALRPSAKTS